MDMIDLAKKGQEIYDRKFKATLEASHVGQFVAIDVFTEDFFLGSSAEEAATKAAKEHPGSFFHLIRIGFSGVYRMGTLLSHANHAIL